MEEEKGSYRVHVLKATFEALCMNGYPPQQVGKWIQMQSVSTMRKVLGDALIALRPRASRTLTENVDAILKEEAKTKIVTDSSSLKPMISIGEVDIVVWRGDICTLKIDAIVNAANSAMLGCFQPDHRCIDNVIHRAAGPRLREACRSLIESEMVKNSSNSSDDDEDADWNLDTGDARITKAFGSLPSKHVIHTVGPIVKTSFPSSSQQAQLMSCYISCLRLADSKKLKSIALCCISTGLFGYPQNDAAKVALQAVKSYLTKNKDKTTLKQVIFNVFLPEDHRIYLNLLSTGSLSLGDAFEKKNNVTHQKKKEGSEEEESSGGNMTLGDAFSKTAKRKRGSS